MRYCERKSEGEGGSGRRRQVLDVGCCASIDVDGEKGPVDGWDGKNIACLALTDAGTTTCPGVAIFESFSS